MRQKMQVTKGPQVVEDSSPPTKQPRQKKRKGSTSRAPPPSPSPPPPSPSPPPSPQRDESEDESVVVGISKLVKAGMYIDYDALSSLNIVEQLNAQGWSLFASFKCDWYHELVTEFFGSMRYLTSSEGRPKIKFTVKNISGHITEDDIEGLFDLPKMGVDDYPQRFYSSKWPLEVEDCIRELNNDRLAVKPTNVYKYNLTGDQKLAFKLVMDVLLPTNSQASELTSVHIFTICALIHKVRINLPAFILKNMFYQSKRSTPWPYGMIVSHLLVHKGIPVEGCFLSKVNKYGKISLNSLPQLELYRWDGGLWSKWEIFEKFEGDRKKVWAEQHVNPSLPVPPPVVGIEEGTSSSAPPRFPPRPSTAGMSHRAVSELTLDIVWRQMQFMREMSESLNQTERFNFFFDASMFPEMQTPVAREGQVDPAVEPHVDTSEPEVPHPDAGNPHIDPVD